MHGPYSSTETTKIKSRGNSGSLLASFEAERADARPDFISADPRPYNLFPTISPPNGSIVHPSPAGTVSHWAISIIGARFLLPVILAIILLRLGSTSCNW